MPQETSTARIAIKYGPLTGLALSLLTMLAVAGQMQNILTAALYYVVFVGGIWRGMYAYWQQSKGNMSYWQGLGLGTMLAALAGLVQGFVRILFFPSQPATFLNVVLGTLLMGAILSLGVALLVTRSYYR